MPAPTSLSAKKLRTWLRSNSVEKWPATEAMMCPIVKLAKCILTKCSNINSSTTKVLKVVKMKSNLPEWNWLKIACQWR